MSNRIVFGRITFGLSLVGALSSCLLFGGLVVSYFLYALSAARSADAASEAHAIFVLLAGAELLAAVLGVGAGITAWVLAGPRWFIVLAAVSSGLLSMLGIAAFLFVAT